MSVALCVPQIPHGMTWVGDLSLCSEGLASNHLTHGMSKR